jgi:hypothetical protein
VVELPSNFPAWHWCQNRIGQRSSPVTAMRIRRAHNGPDTPANLREIGKLNKKSFEDSIAGLGHARTMPGGLNRLRMFSSMTWNTKLNGLNQLNWLELVLPIAGIWSLFYLAPAWVYGVLNVKCDGSFSLRRLQSWTQNPPKHGTGFGWWLILSWRPINIVCSLKEVKFGCNLPDGIRTVPWGVYTNRFSQFWDK